MKKLTLIAFTAVAAMFAIQGCEKARLQDLTPKIIASTTSIYPLNTDTLIFTGATVNDSVKWTVTPAGTYGIRQHGNIAYMGFSKIGTYTVTAQKGTDMPASIEIKVVNPPGVKEDPENTRTNVSTATNDTTTYEPIVGDIKVHFSAGYADSNFDSYSANGDVGATTTCPTGIVQYTATVDASQNYSLDVVNIREHTNCANPASTGRDNWVSQVFPTKLISLGTHQLKITVNGTVYTGSFTVTDESVTINWPYTSGVIMESQLYYKYR